MENRVKKIILFFLRMISVDRWFVAVTRSMRVAEYCEHYFSTYSNPKRVIYPSQFIEEKHPLNQGARYSWRFKNLEGRYSNEAFVLRLDHGKVIGAKGAVATRERILLSDVSREFGAVKPHSVLSLILLKKPKYIKGTVAVLVTDGFNTYYHWMFDVLPRIHLLEKAHLLHEMDYFVLSPIKNSFQKQTLAFFNIDANRIVEAHDANFYIEASNLFVPSLPSLLGTVNPWIVNFLRETVSKIALPDVSFGKRIYIKRNLGGKRNLLNQKEIIQFIDQFGFKVVEAESLSFLEQVSVYRNAEVVLSAHGSGLTNIVFCRPTITIIELFSSDFIVPCFWVTANAASLNYYCGYDREVNEMYTPYWESKEMDFEFPIDKLDGLLKTAQINKI